MRNIYKFIFLICFIVINICTINFLHAKKTNDIDELLNTQVESTVRSVFYTEVRQKKKGRSKKNVAYRLKDFDPTTRNQMRDELCHLFNTLAKVPTKGSGQDTILEYVKIMSNVMTMLADSKANESRLLRPQPLFVVFDALFEGNYYPAYAWLIIESPKDVGMKEAEYRVRSLFYEARTNRKGTVITSPIKLVQSVRGTLVDIMKNIFQGAANLPVSDGTDPLESVVKYFVDSTRDIVLEDIIARRYQGVVELRIMSVYLESLYEIEAYNPFKGLFNVYNWVSLKPEDVPQNRNLSDIYYLLGSISEETKKNCAQFLLAQHSSGRLFLTQQGKDEVELHSKSLLLTAK